VADNIGCGPRQRGEELPRDELESALERVGLAGYAERSSGTLSVGEAQRVSLARTLANRPDVLLLDEPTSALDPGTRRDVEALICSIIRDQGLTCLIVTHNIEQAARMADQAMLLRAGRLVRLGPVEVWDA
jgi:putative ABC transport system ATP-binding protein